MGRVDAGNEVGDGRYRGDFVAGLILDRWRVGGEDGGTGNLLFFQFVNR
jgi:hypothetical protein